MNYPRQQAHPHHQQQQQQSMVIHAQVVVNDPPHMNNTDHTGITASTSTASLSSSSKSNISNTSKTALATSEFESSPYHKKKQLQHQQKERAHRDDIMIGLPSISKHIYNPSSDNSPSSNSNSSGSSSSSSRQRANANSRSPDASSKKSSSPISIEDKKLLQESLHLLSLSPDTNTKNKSLPSLLTDDNINNNNNNMIDLPPLIPIEVIDSMVDDNNNMYNTRLSMTTSQLLQDNNTNNNVEKEVSGYGSCSSDDEDISKYGYGDDNIPAVSATAEQLQQHYNNEQHKQLQEEQKQEEYDSYGYGEEEASSTNNTFTNYDFDVTDDEEEEDSADKYGYGDCEPSTSANDTEEDEAEIDRLLASQYTPTNEYSSTAFCPNRMPRRSSMTKSSVAESESPSSRRSSTSIVDEDALAMPSIEGDRNIVEVLLPVGRPKHDPVKRRRSITFDNDVDVQKIEPIKFLGGNGKDGSKSLWFQENEYETIKMKTLALLDRVDHDSGIIDGKKYCTRGLEKFMTPEASEVKKHQAWDAVLNEQFLQRKDGENDEETLANIYRYSTKRSQSEASKRANQDAVAAEAYLKTTFRRRQSYDKKLEEWKARNGPQFANRRCSM
jgi:hypothetical protein